MRSHSSFILSVVLLCLSSATGFARQGSREAEVDRIFAEWDGPDSPGCVVGVIQDGRFVYQRGYGMANLDYGIPNSPEMVYYVGSVSKQFAAAAAVRAAQEGALSLDDDIRRWLPEMPDYGVPITIRHLVHHTSGIRDIYTLMELAGLRLEDVFPDEDAIALIARQAELNFRPGTDHLYSNSGYFLLSQIVERATGSSLREYAERSLFAPLGMTSSHFHDEPGHVFPNRAISYMPGEDGGYRISYLMNFDKVGAGGLYTTLDDLLRWDANFYDPRVGGAPLLERMHERGVLASGDTLAYAFGLTHGEFRGLRTVGHGGSMMGFRADLVRFADERFTVATLCNLGTIDPGALSRRVAEVYLGDRMATAITAGREAADVGATRADRQAVEAGRAVDGKAAVPDPGALAEFEGEYRSRELDATYRIRLEGGRLRLARRNRPEVDLEPVEEAVFRAGGVVVRFERDGSAGVAAMVVDAGRVRNIRFSRR